jgi:hypothetical protein
MTIFESVIIAVGGLTIGAYLMYLRMKIAILEKEIKNFPTPQELANEILRIKIPISDLPPDVQANMMNSGKLPPIQNKPAKLDKGDSSYIG